MNLHRLFYALVPFTRLTTFNPTSHARWNLFAESEHPESDRDLPLGERELPSCVPHPSVAFWAQHTDFYTLLSIRFEKP